MGTAVEQMVIVDEWRGLYSESWKGVIVDEAFAHPAKFSRALIRKIYDHVIAEGWATKGSSVVDPFGGVALGGFDAMRHGLNWYGCELESKFVDLGSQNIALWNERFSRMPNWGTARLIQGDSRKLVEVLNVAECSVSSPPYGCDSLHRAVNAGREEALPAADRMGKSAWGGGYGNSDGQLSNLPATTESHSIAISSPPYTNDTVNDRNGIDQSKIKKPGGRNSQSRTMSGYGEASGQLGNLAVSSPPYIDSVNSHDHGIDWSKVGPATGNRKRGKGSKHEDTLRAQMAYTENPDPANLGAMPEGDLCVTSPPFMDQGRDDRRPQGGMKVDIAHRKKGLNGSPPGLSHFGDSEGQIGIMPPETFWSASRLILEQLHQVLAPHAHAVFVVKAFVRDKKIVDFPAQWAQLCEAVGFKLLHDHHALLTEHYGTQRGFESDKTLSVERKSFFRRLAESKGSPRIDHENVLCFQKVG